MKKQNQFTVVIPFYNAENTIVDAIESVLNQTYKASQIILVDDGSTDKSVEIIKNLKEQFKEIQYFYQVNNGVSSARNLGVSKAENENIFFLDADDIWLPRKIQVHNEHLNLHPDCVSSFTNFFTFNENDGNLITKNNYINKSPLSSHNLALDICRVNGSCSSFMGNKSSISQLSGFNKDLQFGEDLDLWVRFANKNVICEINELEVAIRTSNKKLGDERSRSSWEISKLYFHIWESNKISLIDKKSKSAARKILRVDIRRNFISPRKILIDYPTRFMKENSEIFNNIFKSKIGYYAYLFLDFWEDFVNMIKKYYK
jgi:glycosyltransferase involved in cell wall biosynthesis